MPKWSFRASLWAIAITGLVTVVFANLILGYGPDGIDLRGVWSDPSSRELLAGSLIPSALFALAALFCRRSVAMQRGIAVAAAIAAVVLGATACAELRGQYIPSRTGPGTGTLSYVAWFLELCLAGVMLVTSAGFAVWNQVCGNRQTNGPA